jgi:hypothetical protein
MSNPENLKEGSAYNARRFYVYDPINRHNVFKTFNLKHASEEEIKKMGNDWIKEKKKEFEGIKEDLKNKSMYDITPFKYSIDDYSGQSIMMIGSTRSGKSTVLNYLMENFFIPKENKFINVLMSNSLQAPVYDQFRDKKNIATSLLFRPEIIKECYQINSHTKNHYKFNIILDDIVDKKFDKELMKLLTIYRNSKLSTIICSQAVQIMNSIGRTNINHVFLFKLNSTEQIEKAIKCYLGGFYPSSFKMVDKIKKYQEMTADHCFIYINNITGDIIRTKLKL